MSNNRRILIVDDNKEIHSDFRKILSSRPESHVELDRLEASLFGSEEKISAEPITTSSTVFELDFADQGEEAVLKATESARSGKPFALIFMDVRMPPGIDGIETTRRIWESCPDAEIVLCTAYSDYSSDEINQRLGRTDQLLILKKPFDPITVRQMALSLTSKWNLSHQVRNHVLELENAVVERTQELQTSIAELSKANQTLDEGLEKLVETQSSLVQSSKMSALGEMAAGIAHEINTPLGAILLISSNISDQLKESQDPSGKELVSQLDDIGLLVERIAKIIRGLRTFSRDSSQDPFKSWDVSAIVDDALQLCGERIKHRSIAVRRTAPQEELFVDCRPGELCQVFLNLLNNAVDAVVESSEKWIAIGIEATQHEIVVCFRDSGPGVPVAVADRIFNPFFTTKDVGKGTGLGLSISKGLVSSHRGQIYLEEGRPTSFCVRLPRSPR
ncbi:MAG: ATP-binding protein [Bdellovibrionota bacterium]